MMYLVSVGAHFEIVLIATFLVDFAMSIPISVIFQTVSKKNLLFFQISTMKLFCKNS